MTSPRLASDRRLSMRLAWMALLGSIVGMACGLPQVGLPAATKMAADAGGDSDSGGHPDTGGNGDAGRDSEKACQTVQFDLTMPEGEVMVVLDRSAAGGDSNQDKCSGCTTYWDSLRDAIEVISGDRWDQFRYGMKLFPSADNSCQVSTALDVPLSTDGWMDIGSLLPSTNPGGPAPATPGLRLAVDTLGASRSAAPKMIVLALAGLPTCAGADVGQDDTSGALAEIGRAAAKGIPVYVLGAGRAQATFDRLASAGNTTTAYSAYEPDVLLGDLQLYAMMNAPCTYALPSDIGSSPVLRLTFDDPQGQRKPVTGFSLATDRSSVTLGDQACSELHGPSVVSLNIEINCPG